MTCSLLSCGGEPPSPDVVEADADLEAVAAARTPRWLRVAQRVWPRPQRKRSTTPEVVNVWTVATHAGDLRRLREHTTTAEIGIFLDLYWDDAILDSPDAAWSWLKKKRAWWDWRDFNPSCPREYRKTDSIRLADYAGLHIELNFDTFAAGPNRKYHAGRKHSKLARDRVYLKAILNILQALEDRGITVHRIWIENEPSYTERNYERQHGPVFTEATYLDRVRKVARKVRRRFPGVQIGAGGTDPAWGIAAWRTGLVDRVGYHRVGSLGGATTETAERNAHRALIAQMTNAGVPASAILADEVNTPPHAGAIRGAVDGVLGRRPRVAGLSWVTITTPVEKNCAFSWSLATWGPSYLEAFGRAVDPHVVW